VWGRRCGRCAGKEACGRGRPLNTVGMRCRQQRTRPLALALCPRPIQALADPAGAQGSGAPQHTSAAASAPPPAHLSADTARSKAATLPASSTALEMRPSSWRVMASAGGAGGRGGQLGERLVGACPKQHRPGGGQRCSADRRARLRGVASCSATPTQSARPRDPQAAAGVHPEPPPLPVLNDSSSSRNTTMPSRSLRYKGAVPHGRTAHRPTPQATPALAFAPQPLPGAQRQPQEGRRGPWSLFPPPTPLSRGNRCKQWQPQCPRAPQPKHTHTQAIHLMCAATSPASTMRSTATSASAGPASPAWDAMSARLRNRERRGAGGVGECKGALAVVHL
jgi:hypothetical protein